MAGPEAALLGLVPSARARRTACFAFLAAHPVLVAAAASLAASSGPDAAASFSPSFVLRPLLEYYSSCWLPRCLFAAIVASLPPVSGLLQHLLGFAAEDDLSAARDGEDSEEPTLEGAAVEANAPVVYGLRHTALNLRVDGYWLNMGYWKDATSFAEACAALTAKVAEAAELRAGDKVLDVGYGCGDQDIYLHSKYGTEEIVGLTIEPVQARLARRRVRELGLQNRIRLYVGDAARLSEFVAATGLIPESYKFDRILAIDCAYHFKTREKFLREAFLRLRPHGRLALADIVPSSGAAAAAAGGGGPADRLARAACALAGIPPENLAAPPAAYRRALEAAGYEDVQMEFVEDDVFPGLARHVAAQAALLGPALAPAASLRLAAVAFFLRRLHASGNWHFVVVSARKPYERL